MRPPRCSASEFMSAAIRCTTDGRRPPRCSADESLEGKLSCCPCVVARFFSLMSLCCFGHALSSTHRAHVTWGPRPSACLLLNSLAKKSSRGRRKSKVASRLPSMDSKGAMLTWRGSGFKQDTRKKGNRRCTQRTNHLTSPKSSWIGKGGTGNGMRPSGKPGRASRFRVQERKVTKRQDLGSFAHLGMSILRNDGSKCHCIHSDTDKTC